MKIKDIRLLPLRGATDILSRAVSQPISLDLPMNNRLWLEDEFA
jgi:hypothetical protein